MIRIGSGTDIGMNRNSSDWLGMNSYPILSPGLVWWKTVKNKSGLIRLIPRHQSKWIRTNPKSSFQSRLIRINPGLDRSKPNFPSESIRIIPTSDSFGLILFESFRARIDQDWKLGFGLVRIHSDWFLGINRIRSDRFLTVFHQMSNKTFLRLVRNDSHWLG